MSSFYTVILLSIPIMIVWGRTLIAEVEIQRLQRERKQDIEELERKLTELEGKVDYLKRQVHTLKSQ